MTTKIKRCLYVGLGGTGMNSLLHTKKLFVDTYGEVPPMIGFLGIDTDSGQYKKSLKSKDGEDIILTPNEQLPILVGNPRPIYDVNKENFTWIAQRNLYALTSMNLGAGQIRSNGRFAFTVNYKNLEQKIQSSLNDISNARIINNSKYELLSTDTEIHMVFSICGGTGSGTFINMAYLLKKVAPKCKLIGYAVLPDVFKAMSNAGMSKVTSNAYGSIKDLDYLMHLGIGSSPVSIDYINVNDHYDAKDRPFNSVVFVDNKNSNNDTYTHVDSLAELISLALVTSAGELSTASASVSDNLEKDIREGEMDIENKKAWAAGMGACEILFRGADLGEIYALKAAQNLIDRFFNSCQDANMIANNWIDDPNVYIRENNNCDHVIDFICSKTPSYSLTVNDKANARPEVDTNLSLNMPKDEDVNKKINDLTSRVRSELKQLIAKHINQECGVSTILNVFDAIDAQLDIFLGEMNSEKDGLVKNEPRLISAMETAVADLKEYHGKFIKKPGKEDDLANDVSDATMDLATCRIEIVRRTAAITIFNNIKGMVAEARSKVNMVSESLQAVKKNIYTEVARKQNNVGNVSQTFQIDLTKDLVTSLSVKPDEIQVSDFIRDLMVDGKLYGFTDLSHDEIESHIMKYARRLATSKNWNNTTIDDVIDQLPEDKFKEIMDLAVKKSMPLFRFNYSGHIPSTEPKDSYYIGVADKSHNRFKENDAFRNMIKGIVDVDFASIGQNDRIIIYRQIGVVPVYSIASIKEYERDYNDCNASCHFDENLVLRMDREDFSIYPKRANDDDLLEFWVKGLVFGLIKNEDGQYYYRDHENGDPLDDFWMPLEAYRDTAYDNFRRHRTTVRREFADYFDAMIVSKGEDAIKAILADVKDNYLDKYSQVNMNRQQIKAHGNERIADLLRDELAYVNKM